MAQANSREKRDRSFVDSLLSIKNDKFEVWKYFEDRANYLSDHLWTTGTWLMTLLAATLSLPFAAKFITVADTLFPIKVVASIPVVLIALFGIALDFYAYVTVLDIRRHIEGNWRRAGYARTGQWKEASWEGRRRHGWNVLLGVGILAFVAFGGLLVLAFLR